MGLGTNLLGKAGSAEAFLVGLAMQVLLLLLYAHIH